ncbi:MAG TPA: hypothetical protein VH637_00125 [Streptosporangiaceae bacterium]|jgi:hypothetical protein
MSGARPEPRWHFLFTPRWLAWHAFVVAAAAGMLWLGNWQFHRAESGNPLSWAYTFEWPVFAVFGVVFWIKTIHDEFRPAAPPGVADDVSLPAGAGVASGGQAAGGPGDDEDEDRELAAYNAYLARLNERVEGQGRWHGQS